MAVKQKWHSLEAEEVLKLTKSAATGLSSEEAQQRLKKFGPNTLPRSKPYSKIRLLLNQFNNPLMYILFGTVAVSLFLRHFSDSIFIGLVMVSNVVVAYWQENKAGNAINSLKKMVKISARVIRNKNEKAIDSTQLVVGDIIILHAGDKVPADARILESRGLRVRESALTGESAVEDKQVRKLSAKTEMADQTCMVFMSTIVEEGFGKAVVVAVGINTQMGEIVRLLAETEEELTPLQKQMSRLAKLAAGFILSIISIILILGLIRLQSPDDILLASLSLAVSAIPAGLLPAITIILVLSMRRILKQNGLVRKLVSSETLGSITVICTDKTGTLTEGDMRVTHMVSENMELTGKQLAAFHIDDPNPATETVKQVAKIAMLNNDAFIENPEAKPKEWITRGKITEQALLRAGLVMGFNKSMLEQDRILIDKIYFSSVFKYSATLRETDSGDHTKLYVIGAPEVIFAKAVNVPGKLQNQMHTLAKQGLRVLAAASREFDHHPKYKNLQEIVGDLNLVGLVALEDPIRDEVIPAIKTTKRAGIRTVIVTGDHRITAMAIAKKIGLPVKDEDVIEGSEIDSMSPEVLRKRSRTVGIFARVSPSHKLKIVDALQAEGEIVAMVGDGVNDAPALKSADIGVAVNSGTDVAKEVADLILLDNGFHSIIKAIEQGRVIFSNIRKVFVYLLADDFQELYVFFAAMAFGLPLPLLPAQILWINLVEDGLPDIALTTEQETDYVMDQKPRPKNESVVSRPLKFWLTSVFCVSGTAALILFLGGLKFIGDIEIVRTMVFVLMGLDSLVFAFSVRSFHKIIFRRDIFSNRWLVGGVIISFMLLISAVYFPPLQRLLSTHNLTLNQWLMVFCFSLVEIIFIELFKMTFLVKRGRPVVL
ncbi:MAG: hypothetical protein A2660_01180 [Candidatus Doudnabacteria bacterium RIFCSPHIGHO2_01_FULL_45_18]|uniref:Cation-transporting P-type ATPase N-terminal domain-containing protein n=1 Tax=Candidatus Doudnabacteria bacterium RIFCSPHIGHO2_01_FULL_45_18 TaxID=1817823 RepID=A0A1F5NRK7_9BACT|nr:MAG: hypothetical protein A2660_01180 [Candidatus Doudnabacteria bacterium RIFCSPHIGHO2_01_FULL_45_18]